MSCRFQIERPLTTVPLLREHAALIKAVRLDTDAIIMVKIMKFAEQSSKVTISDSQTSNASLQ
jgi:hypothetical protein